MNELCGYCGRKHKREKGACPAYGKTCHACRGRNHFSTSCRQKVVNAADNASDETSATMAVTAIPCMPSMAGETSVCTRG